MQNSNSYNNYKANHLLLSLSSFVPQLSIKTEWISSLTTMFDLLFIVFGQFFDVATTIKDMPMANANATAAIKDIMITV